MSKTNLNDKWVKARAFLEARIAVEGDRANDLRAVVGMLDEIRAEVGAVARHGAATDSPRPARDGSTISYYRVEQLGDEDVLAEYRRKVNEPFRCPREIFDKVVGILAKSSKPVEFMEMFDQIRRDLDDGIPDYRPRVCLRYLVGRELVKHARRRFERFGESKDFERRAHAMWENAKRQPWHPTSKS